MYCSKCGKELQDSAKFCSYCGANLSSSCQSESQEKKIIANNLKPYTKIKNSLCLECGYSGPMGVIKTIPFSKKQKAFFVCIRILIILTIFLVIPPLGFIMGFLWGIAGAALSRFIESKYERTILFCPSCQQEVEERK